MSQQPDTPQPKPTAASETAAAAAAQVAAAGLNGGAPPEPERMAPAGDPIAQAAAQLQPIDAQIAILAAQQNRVAQLTLANAALTAMLLLAVLYLAREGAGA